MCVAFICCVFERLPIPVFHSGARFFFFFKRVYHSVKRLFSLSLLQPTLTCLENPFFFFVCCFFFSVGLCASTLLPFDLRCRLFFFFPSASGRRGSQLFWSFIYHLYSAALLLPRTEPAAFCFRYCLTVDIFFFSIHILLFAFGLQGADFRLSCLFSPFFFFCVVPWSFVVLLFETRLCLEGVWNSCLYLETDPLFFFVSLFFFSLFRFASLFILRDTHKRASRGPSWS